MRASPMIVCFLLLQACSQQQERPPEDCEVAKAQFDRCFDRYASAKGDDVLEKTWYSCVPHSAPREIVGSWSRDFEWNAFFEGREPTPNQAFSQDMMPRLAFKTGVTPPAEQEGQARLWRLTFVGREETCDLFPDSPKTIFVEKILEQELIWEVEGYPSYSFD